MAHYLDKDTRLLIVAIISIVQIALVGALILYFRKKENDTLNTVFNMQDRLRNLEYAVQTKLGSGYSKQLMPPPPADGQ